MGRWRDVLIGPGSKIENSVIFAETKLKGAFVIDLDRKEDSRGFFARGSVRRNSTRMARANHPASKHRS
jgi:dTDP-4-dehydrorhamnose 3,5-epimerase-like enzyme